MERLHSKHGATHVERDQADREHNKARQGVRSLWVDLGTTVARRLEAESIFAGLVTELAKTRGIFQAESNEHDLLRTTVEVVFDDQEVARPEGTGSLVASAAIDIMAWVRQLEEDAFHAGITQAFAVARSHYDQEINLESMSLGFTPGYENSELDEIEKVVTPIAQNLADRLKDIVLPLRK